MRLSLGTTSFVLTGCRQPSGRPIKLRLLAAAKALAWALALYCGCELLNAFLQQQEKGWSEQFSFDCSCDELCTYIIKDNPLNVKSIHKHFHHTHTHTHAHTNTHTLTHIHTHKHTQTHTETHEHTHVPSHAPSHPFYSAADIFGGRYLYNCFVSVTFATALYFHLSYFFYSMVAVG
jgi:ABC-type Zn2+ transport system substrate-binding protein/surface adhesin